MGYAVVAGSGEILLLLVVAGGEGAARVLRRGREDLGRDPAFELRRQLGRIAALVIEARRLGLEPLLQQLQRLGVAAAVGAAAGAELDPERVVHLALGLLALRIVARAEGELQLLRHRRDLGHELRRPGVRRIEAVGDPDRPDMVETGEVVVVRGEPRHVVGVIVRQDDEGQAVVGRLLQILHAVVDAADVGGVDAAIDQDVGRPVIARHRQQEEVAEADAVHADADAELAADLRPPCPPFVAGLVEAASCEAGPGCV